MGVPFPGPFSFNYHPWAKEVHDSQARMNVAMKAAQTGLTEVCINRAFYTLDMLRRDVLYVLPTTVNAGDFSKGRFGPALTHSAYLKRLFTNTNSEKLKQTHHGTTLYIRGSRGDSNLKSIPVSDLYLDEVDEMDQSQIWLAFERLSGQLDKTIFAISTPTVPEHGISLLYEESSQEHFMFTCPCCSRLTELVWPDCMEIIGESVSDPRCHESFLKCKECGGRLEQADKPNFLSSGKWVPTNPDANMDNRGFHINQLYSFTVTPGEIVIAHFRGMGDEGAGAEFHKSKLGKPYVPEGGQILDEQIDNCVKGHSKNDTPPLEVEGGHRRIITMGVDQGNWLHTVVIEWFFEAFGKDLNSVAIGKLLWFGKFNVQADNGWGQLRQMMRTWQVLHCVVDADPNTNDARQFARAFPGYVSLCRYRRGVPQKELAVAEMDDMRTQVVTVDRTSWLDISLGRYKTAVPRMHLPRDTNIELRDHLKALVRTYKQDENDNPVATYMKPGNRADHYAHSLNYGEIALPFAASYVRGTDIRSFL